MIPPQGDLGDDDDDDDQQPRRIRQFPLLKVYLMAAWDCFLSEIMHMNGSCNGQRGDVA
jgi:hypothetical protein